MTEIDTDLLADKIAERLAERLDDRPLLRVTEAAARLSVSRRQFDKMVAEGKLRTVRLTDSHRSLRVEAAELDRYLATRRTTPMSGLGDGPQG